MTRNWKTLVAGWLAVFLLASVAAMAATGDKAKVEGMIISRAGETFVVQGDSGKTTVVLSETTKVQDRRVLGLQKMEMGAVVLIPGLKVSVDGTSDAKGRVAAKTITVDGDDLEAAEMIQAGLHPTAQQVVANEKGIAANKGDIAANQKDIAGNKQAIAANQAADAAQEQRIQANLQGIQQNTDRFMALSEYDVKGEASVKFASGSAKVSAADQEELKKLSETAKAQKGYIVEVVGYADSTGNAAMNTKLSEDRAKAVITFLVQQGGVPVRHIVAPGAMGEYGSTSPNETKEGRADNRRVDVKVLVNKGIAGN